MKIIAVVNEKGGVGKSTISINLSRALAKKGLKTAVLDLDPNQCSYQQMYRRQMYGVDFLPPIGTIESIPNREGMNKTRLLQLGVEAFGEMDVVILDGPAGASEMSREAATVSDLVLVPIMPTAMSINGSQDLLKFIDASLRDGSVGKAAIVWNRVMSKRTSIKIAQDTLAAMRLMFPMCPHQVRDAGGYAQAESMGVTVFEQSFERNSRDDISALGKWAMKEMGL